MNTTFFTTTPFDTTNVYVEPPPPPPYTIFVTNAKTGDTYLIELAYNDTIETLKRLVLEKTGVPVDVQSLVFQGEDLPTSGPIENCFLPEECHLYLLNQLDAANQSMN